MFFSNKEDKLQLKVIDQNYASIVFKNDGTVIKANKIFLDTMGYTLNEIVGKHHSMFCDKKFVESNQYKEAWDILNRGKSITSEFKRIKKDGDAVFLRASYMPIADDNGKVYQVIKLAQNITEKRLKDLFYLGQVNAINKSQAVIEFDMQGTVLNANKNFLDIFGYSLEEIIGKNHSTFCDEKYKTSNEYQEFWKKLNRGEYDANEYLRITKNRQQVWIQGSYNPILDLDGDPFKVVQYATDITLKKTTMFSIGKEIEELTKSLQHLKNASLTMVDEAKITMEGSQEVTVSIEELNQAVQELSNKIEIMLSSITNIFNTTSESEKVISELKNQSNETTIAMNRLNEESIKIGDTINVITQIAFQTNILSLNAAVEAATAGEAGKGFAVVAGEVRNLASRSNDAAKDITSAIGFIQSLVRNSLDSIHNIDSKVDEISSMSFQISSSMSEQKTISNELASTALETSQTLNQITNNMVRVSNSASSTDKEAEKTKDNSNELIEVSNRLIDTLKVLN
ncbi:methyl-accepting chemotaxis protein [Aliarcobacter lanthieri]|uniref:methyl-accepting chemotaxis protein n=1 Tax=Aliarcobacter lanthieri TaxID=1355374 RepID=UPI003AB03C2D